MASQILINESIQTQLMQEIETLSAQGYTEILIHAQQNAGQEIDAIVKIAPGQITEILHLFPDLETGDLIFCYHSPQPLNTKNGQLDFASYLNHQGIGFALINKTGSKLRLLCAPSLPKNKIKPLDLETVADALKAGGTLSQLISHYEVREKQIEMLEFIANHFNTHQIGIAEGSTGVGKSFAYLIPAIKWVTQNPQRVLISTATIALQQQLLQKDIPFVKKILKSDIKAVLVKGRKNYLCLHHLDEVLAEEKLFLKEDDPLAVIEKWAESTKTGDKVDLPFLPKEDLWARISSDTETCLGSKCQHYQNCFIFKARKAANHAQILVVNHHLFFADLVVRSQVEDSQLSILPPFHKVIFDEAHQIESSAVHFFSAIFSFHSLQRALIRLSRRRGNKEMGLLAQLKDELPASHYHEKLMQETHQNFDACSQANQNLYETHSHLNEMTIRVSAQMPAQLQQQFMAPLHSLYQKVVKLTESLDKVREELNGTSQHAEILNELSLLCKRFAKFARILEHFTHFEQYAGYVFWAEQRRTRFSEHYYTYIMTPLDIGQMLHQLLYKQDMSLIMVSATLTFNHNFHFFLQKIGLAESLESINCAYFPSPFDYEKNVCFIIPKDLASIEYEQEFSQQSHELILEIIQNNPGRGILILFTSYFSLRNCAEFLQEYTTENEIPLLKQGDLERQELIDQFVKSQKAILLGTDSFWEGVDLSNEALKILIIMRLPFQPPNSPLMQAKQEMYERAGMNPFLNLQVPEAAIKLKQGFGRLMRKTTDSGCIVLLDQRIIRKKYGEFFLETLPMHTYINPNCKEIPATIHTFLLEDKNDIDKTTLLD